jgi:hypothetical protein
MEMNSLAKMSLTTVAVVLLTGGVSWEPTNYAPRVLCSDLAAMSWGG